MTNWKAVGQLESKTIRITEQGTDPSGFGLCDSCGRMNWSCTRHGKEWAYCDRGENITIPLNQTDPIVSCSSFYRRGALTLNDMFDMATLINIRKPMGFSGGQVEVEIVPPTEEDDK